MNVIADPTAALPRDTTSQDRTAAYYVHIPFCESKCSYCDFYSVPHDGSGRSRYVAALGIETARRAPANFVPATVFVGGGTPTALDDRDFAAMLELVGGIAGSPGARENDGFEWTVECNPGSLTPHKARAMRDAGVTRISIGVQSFDDQILRSVGRVHDGATARAAVAIARAAEIPQISIDLLFAIPGQGLATFTQDLELAVALGTDHVSAYALLYEEGTALERKRVQGLVSPEAEDVELTMLRLAKERLADAGFHRYEISNFAKVGSECRHNLNYWRNGAYLGVGAGAASYMAGERRMNIASWRAYEEKIHSGENVAATSEHLSPDRSMGEEVMLRLRTTEGFSLRELSTRWGIDAAQRYASLLRRYSDAALLELSDQNDRVRFSERGLEVADGVLATFVNCD